MTKHYGAACRGIPVQRMVRPHLTGKTNMYEQNLKTTIQDYAQEERNQQKRANSLQPERMPEVQREHETLMGELSQVSKLMAELSQKLSPVRAEQPERVAAAICGVGPVAPMTDIGQRIRAAHAEVAGMRRRVETLLSEIEV